MLKSHYGQVRVNNKLETRTFARDLFSLFVSPGCKTEMMTFHGDIFNFLGRSEQNCENYHSFFSWTGLTVPGLCATKILGWFSPSRDIILGYKKTHTLSL